MVTSKKETNKLNKIIAVILIAIMTVFCTFTNKSFAATETIQPTEDQYLELRAVSIDDVAGQNKQVIMELWSHNLDYKGFEVTFAYDDTLFQTSNINTNAITDDETEYFKFENEFNNKVDLFVVGGTSANVLDMTFSLNTPISEATSHIVSDGGGGYKITTDEVLIGKLSFQMPSDSLFTIEGFHLVTNSYTPQTGIKIDKSLTECYQEQSTFRFTDQTASRNANLSNLIVSSGTVDEDEPENSTYKEYSLTPTFDKDTVNYEITLLEYKDKLDIKAIEEDNTATMKIKVPKRNEDDELEYEGSEIKYEEIDLDDNTPLEVAINKMGEPNTNLTIVVTAEDGVTTKEYTVTIKRPYGIVKGKDILADFDDPDVVENIRDNYGVTVTNSATVNFYDTGLARWEEIHDIYAIDYENPFTYDDLELIPKLYSEETQDNGEFEIYVVPGHYDIQVTRLAYLDYVYVGVEINEGDVIDMGEMRLPAGDVDRNGVITAEDTGEIKAALGVGLSSSDEEFSERYNPTQIGEVITEDMAYVKGNQDLEIQVVNFY